jgi:hypothetical protein
LQNESSRLKGRPSHPLTNLAGLFLIVLGLAILAGVGWLTWFDATSWGKDITLILFGSRAGEAVSLGIGMKIIHYFVIGSALLLSGSIIFLRRRIKTMRTRKMSEGVVVTIPTIMVETLRKQAWFKHYHDIGDFILNAVKKSIENWEDWEKGEHMHVNK